MKKIALFTGNLGSGKTEIAINYALNILKKGKPCTLVDLDIINPYLRSRRARSQLLELGLNVICPEGKLADTDLPALSPAVYGVLQGQELGNWGVFDIGGDDVGATVLGRFKPYLHEGGYDLFFVVNCFRPFTSTADGVIKYLKSIEKASRLKVTALVANGHLGQSTHRDDVLKGLELTQDVAAELSLPVGFVAVRRDLYDEVANVTDTELLGLDLFMTMPWQGLSN